MLPSSALAALAAADCEVRTDRLTRGLYATDASIHRIEPAAVAFPRNVSQARAAILAAREAGLPVTPRGAGTGLVGGALGPGLVVDFSRHECSIGALDLERRTVRVGAGVVLDTLNAFLKPHGFCFGPDVATSSRATLGGMIANNSSGSHVPVYGTTADHVVSLEVVLADGRVETLAPGRQPKGAAWEQLRPRLESQAALIRERMPADLLKRWPGYGLDRFVREPSNLGHLLAGSEGTLAAVASAELRIVPVPRERGVGLIFFDTVAEALQATVELLPLRPAAIEHIDRVLTDQTRGQLAFQAARELLELDTRPSASVLIVEFFDEDVAGRLEAMRARRLGRRTLLLRSPAEAALMWNLRKAGVALLTGCKGDAKPVTGIEDTAVRPRQLPEYVAGLQAILAGRGLAACYYGHAASGLLHVRPVLDLREPGDLRKFREVMGEVSALVRQFKGSLAAEHGVGLARTEFMSEQLGEDLLRLMRSVKQTFDPENRFNPGKVLPDGRYRCDEDLRAGPGSEVDLPFTPVLAYAAKDQSFTRHLDQCNGCGGCRKSAPTMCPTFLATGEEALSTRGRANLIRMVLQTRRTDGPDPLAAPELAAALEPCLGCKACATECPSNVNLALLKAELLHARHERDGVPWPQRLLGAVDLLGRLGCLVPDLANDLLQRPWLRHWLADTVGLTARRPLPAYARERFDQWWARRLPARSAPRGPVILWDDTFVRYHEPQIGRAAVRVLEAAGFSVQLARGRRCCGRPAFSQGDLDAAARAGRHNLALLARWHPHAPILFLEPSCYSMFVDDYRELKLAGVEEMGRRCFLFEQFLDRLLQQEPGALRFREGERRLAIHAHCHAKALLNVSFLQRLGQAMAGRPPLLLETGCCGMAGAFGALESKYDLSVKIAQPLVSQLRRQPRDTFVVASGTSCRHQIAHLTSFQPLHMAEVMADAILCQ